MKTNERVYMRRFLLAMAAYIITLMLSLFILNRMETGVWRFLVAIIPVVPLLFGVLAYVTYLGQIDELQQRIQLQAVSFAAAMTGLLTFTYGLLENTELPALSYTYVFPLTIFLWGIGLWLFKRSYT